MEGVILTKQKKDIFYTHMSMIFEALGNVETQYNWLITDYECNYYQSPITFDKRHDYIWLPGEELSLFIKENDLQFIWGVFSAFPKNIDINGVLKYELPKSNKDFFNKKRVEMQHPLSTIEIVSCDSSSVFVISNINDYINSFSKHFPAGENLQEYINKL